jgi:site-specific DNA-methyltransferase (adenine-specific)
MSAFAGAARFFYSTKASPEDREAGTGDLEEQELRRVNSGGLENEPRYAPRKRRNNHPTCKPEGLYRWLVRLACRPGGLVLDPFTGSGTTGRAAMFEGRRFLGIEKGPKYFKIASARVADAAESSIAQAARRARAKGQPSLFVAPEKR